MALNINGQSAATRVSLAGSIVPPAPVGGAPGDSAGPAAPGAPADASSAAAPADVLGGGPSPDLEKVVVPENELYAAGSSYGSGGGGSGGRGSRKV